MTYLDILAGKNMKANAEDAETETRDLDDDDQVQEAEDEDCPKICIKKEERARLRNPWKQTLIIEV